MTTKKPIQPITEKHVKLLQKHSYDVHSVAEAEVVVGMMPMAMQLDFFRDAEDADPSKKVPGNEAAENEAAENTGEKKLSDLVAPDDEADRNLTPEQKELLASRPDLAESRAAARDRGSMPATMPDPAPPDKLAQRMCSSCGKFIEHVKVKRSDPGTLHGTCRECQAAFTHDRSNLTEEQKKILAERPELEEGRVAAMAASAPKPVEEAEEAPDAA